MSPDDRWRVAHMIEAAEQALAFVAGRHRTDLDTDAMLRLALTRAVEIVGEAASQVSDAGRLELANVPWSQIVGMPNRPRHNLAHKPRDLPHRRRRRTLSVSLFARRNRW